MFGEGVSGFGHSRGARRSILLSLGPLSGMNAFVRVWVVLCLIIYVSKIHPLSTANVSSSGVSSSSSVSLRSVWPSALMSSENLASARTQTSFLAAASVPLVSSPARLFSVHVCFIVWSAFLPVRCLGSVLTVAPESGMIAALPCPHGISASSSDSAVASSVHMNTFRLLPHSVSAAASFVTSSSVDVSRLGSVLTVAPESGMIAALPCPHGISASSSDSAVASSVHTNTFRLLPHSVSVVASFVASSSMNVSRVGSLPTVAPESKMIAALPCPHGISASSSDSAVTSSVHMYTFSGVTLMPICLTLS